MIPVELRTTRLVLNQPIAADIDACTAFCQDPIFEQMMMTPWPYERSDAEEFLLKYVPEAWQSGQELSWAIRLADHPDQLIGMIGLRRERCEIGYWVGSPFRGMGIVPEAATEVLRWNRETGAIPEPINWRCVVGNIASARAARAAGFRFRGFGIGADRAGTEPAWLGDFGNPEPGLPWPSEVDGPAEAQPTAAGVVEPGKP